MSDEAASLNTPPQHHIAGDMLLAYATGTLGQAASLMAATHLSLCPSCRAGLAAAEVVGGALLEDIPPEPISEAAFAKTLSRLEAVSDVPLRSSEAKAKSLFGTPLPRCVLAYLPDDLSALRWRWLSPGVKYIEMLKDAGGVKLGLIKTIPGAAITPHGHTGEELTVVLSGGYRDGNSQFRRGDIQSVDENIVHQPVTDTDGGCLSLLMMSGPIKPTGLIARIFCYFTGF